MNLKILTPEKQIINLDVTQVTVPTSSGEITILPGHTDLLSTLSLGNITFRVEGKTNDDFITIESGFLSTDGKQINILADTAINSKEYDDQQLEQIKLNAENIIKNAPKDANIEKLKSETRIAELHITSKKRRKI